MAAGIAVPAAAALIAATAGDPQPRHLDHAVALRHALPEELRSSADSPEHAQAVMLALLIFPDTALRDRQLAVVAARLGTVAADRVQRATKAAASLPPMLRLPAVLQLFPALRALTPGDRLHFMQLLQELTRIDGRVSAFDYALEKLVTRGLGTLARPRDPHGRLALSDCPEPLGVVFAVLARHGAQDATQARHAYEAGMASLLPQHRPSYCVIEDWVPAFDKALDELCALQIAAKHLLVEGLVRTIAHDETLTPAEGELLRTICAVLECPLPPILPSGATG
jgi:hypothetical protein